MSELYALQPKALKGWYCGACRYLNFMRKDAALKIVYCQRCGFNQEIFSASNEELKKAHDDFLRIHNHDD